MTASLRRSVAIVEDDEQVRRALERLLTTVGYDVRTYGSAEDFVADLSVRVPACLVLDAHLPKMDGLALFAMLRRGAYHGGVVFITADHDLAASEQMQQTGSPCLCKPLDAKLLVGAIDAVVGSAR